ncbi:AgmX/PglI C-terminal domain-containing protein [bacterium]|nr:AgmX/PglI C-terminal domain-containing protein [bacterium]
MKKLLVVVIIAVIVALLLAYKCSRSRGANNVETLPETSQPAPAAEPAPKAEEPAPAKEEPAEKVNEEPAPEQKKEPAPAPAKEPKKEVRKAKPAAEKSEMPEKVEKPAPVEKETPKAQPVEKKPVERDEKPVPGSPAPALSREPVSSNIDSAGVTKVINVSRAAIKRCYDKALMSNPQLKGKLSVKIVINQQGRVDSTEIVDDSLHDAEVSKCVRGVIGRLRFPKPADGTATVTFPFAFDPKNQ